MDGGPRLGWLGGSFDPVHEGHLHVARGAARALRLSRVLLVPAHQPPHKRDRTLAPDDDRLALLQLACRDDARLLPCDLELRRGGVSWSIDTARAILAAEPEGTRLFAIVGADTLADLPTWRQAAELLRLVTFCPVARDGRQPDATPLLAVAGPEPVDRIRRHVLHLPPHPASSTAVRAALAMHGDPPWLPPGVLDEIRRRGLYGYGPGGASSSDSSGAVRSKP
jgi:nicotinate-nucleotide adenylyltransferase